jgi:hypothetical protein
LVLLASAPTADHLAVSRSPEVLRFPSPQWGRVRG